MVLESWCGTQGRLQGAMTEGVFEICKRATIILCEVGLSYRDAGMDGHVRGEPG